MFYMFELPNGKLADSTEQYKKEWDRVREQLEARFSGYTMASFGAWSQDGDPRTNEIVMTKFDSDTGRIVYVKIPTQAALDLIESTKIR